MRDSETISVVEACRRARLTYPVAMRLIMLGRLQAEKIDGRWRVSEDSCSKLCDELSQTCVAVPR